MRRRVRRWSVRLMLSVVTMVAGYVLVDGAIRIRVREIDLLAERYAKLEEELRRAEYLLQTRDSLARRLEAVHRISAHAPTIGLMRVLADAISDDTYLVFVGVDRPLDSIGADPSGRLKVRGRAMDHRELGALMTRLWASRTFHDVKLVSAAMQPGNVVEREIEFELACIIRKDLEDG